MLARPPAPGWQVAFWGDGAVEGLGLGQLGDRLEIVCNLAMGGTNPREIKRLMATGANVLQHDTLHGKVYLFPDAAIIGSSNASANGLSFQGDMTGWEEANTYSVDPSFVADVSHWVDNIFAGARAISETDLKSAAELWTRRRRHIKIPGARGTLLDALRSNPEHYADRRLYLVAYSDDMDDDGHRALEHARQEYGLGEELDAYQDWPELPDDADILSIRIGPNGGVGLESYWHMPNRREEVPAGEGSSILLCRKVRRGTYPNPGPRSEWAAILDRISQSELWNEESAIVEMGDLARRFL